MWGYEQSDINEKFHLRFVDFELNLKSGTQNLMVCGLTGSVLYQIQLKRVHVYNLMGALG